MLWQQSDGLTDNYVCRQDLTNLELFEYKHVLQTTRSTLAVVSTAGGTSGENRVSSPSLNPQEVFSSGVIWLDGRTHRHMHAHTHGLFLAIVLTKWLHICPALHLPVKMDLTPVRSHRSLPSTLGLSDGVLIPSTP